MKAVSIFLCAVFFAFSASAQIPRLSKEEMKSSKEYRKETQKNRDVKLKGASKKELKDWEAEGWKPAGGAAPLVSQIAARDMMEEARENGLCYAGDGEVTGTNVNMIRKEALMYAKQDVAEQLEGNITELLESNGANENDSQSYSKFLSASKELIAKRLGTVQPIISRMRDNGNGTKTIVIRVYYNKDEADRIAREALSEKLASESAETKDRLSKILGW